MKTSICLAALICLATPLSAQVVPLWLHGHEAVSRTPDIDACGSVVVVRCRDRQRPGAEAAARVAPPAQRLQLERLVESSFDANTVVVVGKRVQPRAVMLRELLAGAGGHAGAMTFRTVENPDGTRCTCASEPCVMNCCVCSARR